jgi:transposase
MRCKFCHGCETVLNGKVGEKQRYKCKECCKSFTDTPFHGVCPEKRRLAVSLYASGLSLRRIGQFFGVSTVAALKWVRKYGETECVKPVPSQDSVIVMEVDEFWHFLKKKEHESGSSKRMIAITNDLLTGNLEIVLMKPSSVSTTA